jgi:hypothetical protein
MVRLASKPSLRDASCCRVEVVKGGAGERRPGFFSTAEILKLAFLTASRAVEGRGLVGEVELGEPLALVLGEPRDEGVGSSGDVGLDGPVFLGLELLDLDLAIDDQPQADRLYAARRARPRQLAPQHRRKGEAHQVVERATGQVGVHQFHVDVARIAHRLGDRSLGDGVEHHPLHGRALDGLLLLQHLEHVPGDGLAFAIRVGGEDDLVGALGGHGDVVQPLGRLHVHVPRHGEVLVRPDRSILGRQVADVTVGRQDRVVGSQILVDGLGLGRALDDDDVHAGVIWLRGRSAHSFW